MTISEKSSVHCDRIREVILDVMASAQVIMPDLQEREREIAKERGRKKERARGRRERRKGWRRKRGERDNREIYQVKCTEKYTVCEINK